MIALICLDSLVCAIWWRFFFLSIVVLGLSGVWKDRYSAARFCEESDELCVLSQCCCCSLLLRFELLCC